MFSRFLSSIRYNSYGLRHKTEGLKLSVFFLFTYFNDLVRFVSLGKKLFDTVVKLVLVLLDHGPAGIGYGVLGHEDGTAVLVRQDGSFVGSDLL